MYEGQCESFVRELGKCNDQLTKEHITTAKVKLDRKEIKFSMQRSEFVWIDGFIFDIQIG